MLHFLLQATVVEISCTVMIIRRTTILCEYASSPARAVVPPPRLRAKWVSFSALLHLGQNYAGWGSDPISEFGNTCGTLRRYVVFNEACANEQAGRFGSRLGKRVSFFLKAMR